MPSFRYVAKDLQGKIYKGILEASSEREVRKLLKAKKLYVVSVKKESDLWKTLTYKKKVTLPELVLFTSQFATLLRSGIILTECLSTLATQTDNAYFRDVLFDVRKNVDAGLSLSEALSRYPNVFPKIFISLVRAGEVTGSLDVMLDKLSKYFDLQHELREKIKSATTYPLIVTIAAIIVVIFMLTFVIPTFQRVYARTNVPLPLPTRITISLGNFIKNNILIILILISLFIVGVRQSLKNKKVKRWWDEYKLKIPKIGKLWRQILLARFTSTFYVLITGGILITQSLEILEDVIGNLYFSEHLRKMLSGVLEGRNLSDMMDEEVFTPLLKQMIVVGERSGRLDTMLEEYTRFAEREIDIGTKRITSMIEPALTIFLGVVVFFIVISMYLPMFNMVRLFRR
ncbi:MAG: type II secretion system F family protein [Dictyoglomus thermophilum]|uniref:Type II secretion system F family protein n=1 Tax=Dictyoglomus thermophilum TaxID=14 RepID=A0A7C2CMA4_DICTH|nr:type II secretion system F family protein [Dictyoglomus thermophilum]MCX7721039.1 type II secretion system F family protein [Dictyoglomus thermophilum]TYT22496.1 type II secretion system F family protein [Dictyoglomus thermophilum]